MVSMNSNLSNSAGLSLPDMIELDGDLVGTVAVGWLLSVKVEGIVGLRSLGGCTTRRGTSKLSTMVRTVNEGVRSIFGVRGSLVEGALIFHMRV